MANIYADFKLNIGDRFSDEKRDISIIEREYRQVKKRKSGTSKEYTANEKWYKYHCNKCGNEDYLREDYIVGKTRFLGCNACCTPPRKIVHGINDITVTAPWMVQYFENPEEAKLHSKYSKDFAMMKCPDCGRVFKKQIMCVCANHGLSCVCGDGMSYPNKFMYSLLSQLNLNFEIEKKFDWSSGKIYDDYITYKDLKIITEQHGIQHYIGSKGFSKDARSFEEEAANDNEKRRLAYENGIDFYFEIDSRISTAEFMRDSICNSGLLSVLGIDESAIDWNSCDVFATSNLVKIVCHYKAEHPEIALLDIASKFKLSYKTILGYVKIGNTHGWCSYSIGDDRALHESQNVIQHYSKPIYCETNNMYYRDAGAVEKYLVVDGESFYKRQIRQAITRGNKYRGYTFKYIEQPEFNNAKALTPDRCIGDSFYL